VPEARGDLGKTRPGDGHKPRDEHLGRVPRYPWNMRALFVCVVVLAISHTTPAHSFDRETTQGCRGVQPLWLKNRQMNWLLSTANLPVGCSSSDAVKQAVEDALGQWAQATRTGESNPCTDLAFSLDFTASAAAFDASAPGNLIVVRKHPCSEVVPAAHACKSTGTCADLYNCWDYSKDALAMANYTYEVKTGAILGADIELNGWNGSTSQPKGFWFTCFPTQWDAASSPCATPPYELANCTSHDVGSIVANQFGRALGFKYSNVPSSTMTSSLVPGSLSPRILTEEDVEGVCSVYPSGAPALDAPVIPPLAVTPSTVQVAPRQTVTFQLPDKCMSGGFVLETNASGAQLFLTTYTAGPKGDVTDVLKVANETETVLVHIAVGPAISVSASADEVSPGEEVQFTAQGGKGGPYLWSFATNASGGAINPDTGVYIAGGARGTLDLVQAKDALGNLGIRKIQVAEESSAGPDSVDTPPRRGCSAGPGESVALFLSLVLPLLRRRSPFHWSNSRVHPLLTSERAVRQPLPPRASDHCRHPARRTEQNAHRDWMLISLHQCALIHSLACQ
jgi:hypothetical protein